MRKTNNSLKSAGLFLAIAIIGGTIVWWQNGVNNFHLNFSEQITKQKLKDWLEFRSAEAAPPEKDVDLFEFPAFDQQWWHHVIETESQVLAIDAKSISKPLQQFRTVGHEKDSVDSRGVQFSPKDMRRSSFWSFQLLQRPSLPETTNQSWIRNPIDAFVLAKLESKDVSPTPQADLWSLGRRIWIDLQGLPPTPHQISEFVNHFSEENYHRVVDELMNQPSFGEHWASFWLDLARYADSNGYEEDELKPFAFPYRDFVIWSMNQDLPFDKFVRWQVAGDILAPDRPMAVAATGFFTNAPINTFRPQESERFDELADQVSTLGRAMLGLSVGCARCHDHFYDSISHEEYHGLVAIFKDTKREKKFLVPDGGAEYQLVGAPVQKIRNEITQMMLESQKHENIEKLDLTDEEKDLLRQTVDPNNTKQALLLSKCFRCLEAKQRWIDDDDQPLEKDRPRYEELLAKLNELEPKLLPLPPMGLTLAGDTVAQMPILQNGKSQLKGRLVGPGLLSELTTGFPDEETDYWKDWSDTPRAALANWMTDTERGAGALVARVIVNRLWQNHFGSGLVTTTSDFGANGATPSHPELLEWLACELVDNGWRLKHIHRLIVTSSTYRQSTEMGEKQKQIDADNRLFSRQNMIRMSAEVIRDSILKCSDALDPKMYGRPVFPEIPTEAVYNTQESIEYTWPTYLSDASEKNRRSIYLVKKRTIPVPFLSLFDLPDRSFSCESRGDTTLPTQALALLNSPFPIENAKRLKERLDGIPDTATKIRQAYLMALSRLPTESELAMSIEFIGSNSKSRHARLTDFCHVLFLTNDFIYRN